MTRAEELKMIEEGFAILLDPRLVAMRLDPNIKSEEYQALYAKVEAEHGGPVQLTEEEEACTLDDGLPLTEEEEILCQQDDLEED
jgi:hypothetical protein